MTALQELHEELKEANSGNPFISTNINLIIAMVEAKMPVEDDNLRAAFWEGQDGRYIEFDKYYADTYLEK